MLLLYSSRDYCGLYSVSSSACSVVIVYYQDRQTYLLVSDGERYMVSEVGWPVYAYNLPSRSTSSSQTSGLAGNVGLSSRYYFGEDGLNALQSFKSQRSHLCGDLNTPSTLPVIGEEYPLVLLGSTWYYLRSPAGNFLWVSAI